MRDAAGAAYELMIFAADEQFTVVGDSEIGGGYSLGDRKVKGLWQTTLRKKNGPAVKQKVLLFGYTNRGEFNLDHHMVFVLRGGKGQPDILVVESYGCSNGNDGRLFAIKGGTLRRLAGVWYTAHAPFRLHSVGPFRFRSSDYDNSVCVWTISDWTFKVAAWKFVRTGSRKVPNSATNLEAIAR